MKIGVFTKYDEQGASSRVRAYAYRDRLAAEGIECSYFPLFDSRYLGRLYADNSRNWLTLTRQTALRAQQLFSCRSFDALWIEYELFPYLPALGERFVQLLQRPYLVDYDDAIFHNYDATGSQLKRLLLGRKIDFVMRNAAVVTVANSYLAKRAESAGAQKIVRLPTVVDPRHYERIAEARPPGPFRIGWIGTPVTARYLAPLRQPLEQLAQKREIEIRLIGTSSSPLDSAGSALAITYVPWRLETEADELSKIDVGVMPLPEAPWARGKSAYKLLQYMAMGKPVVASPVGANAEVVVPGLNGFLTTTKSEWLAALDQLAQSPGLRATLGSGGRRTVAEGYTYEQTTPELVKALRGLEEIRRR